MARQINITKDDIILIGMMKVARNFGMTDKDFYGMDFTNHWINQ